jgi:hypothetical protein
MHKIFQQKSTATTFLQNIPHKLSITRILKPGLPAKTNTKSTCLLLQNNLVHLEDLKKRNKQ